MSELDRIKTENCPFTGKPYDCSRCTQHETLTLVRGPATFHIGLVFEGLLLDGKKGHRDLHAAVGGKAACSLSDCINYFTDLHMRGAA